MHGHLWTALKGNLDSTPQTTTGNGLTLRNTGWVPVSSSNEIKRGGERPVSGVNRVFLFIYLTCRLFSLRYGMQNLLVVACETVPWPGIEPGPPALGAVSATGPPGPPWLEYWMIQHIRPATEQSLLYSSPSISHIQSVYIMAQTLFPNYFLQSQIFICILN